MTLGDRSWCGAIWAALVLLVASPATAQRASVTIDLDRHIGRVGEPMRVTVKVDVSGRAGYSEFIRPAFKGFRVLGTGLSGSNMQIDPLRGVFRRSETKIFMVVPLKAGMHNVGPAAVRMGGRLVRSPVVKLKVIPANVQAPDPHPNPGQTDPIPAPQNQQRVVFLTSTANPKKVYLGQQVLASWHLYTRARLNHFQSGALPATDDFWSEDLASPSRLRFEEKSVDGTQYYAAVLAKKALFPQKTGRLTVGSMKVNVTTVLDRLNPSSTPQRQSPPLIIDVLPLPEQGQPAGFSPGNVGSYFISASLDRDTVKAGDAVTLRMVVRGQGNLRQLKLPAIKTLAGFKVYEPKVSERLDRDQGIRGEKMVEYLLMPVASGRLRIPGLVLDTFDPRSGRYRRLKTSPLALQVKGKMPRSLAARQASKTNVLDRTIRPPRPARHLSNQQPIKPLDSNLFWVLLVLPVGLLVLVAGGEHLRERLTRQTPRRQRRAASRRISKHLKQARELRRQGDKAAFFGEISAALRDLLDHKLGLLTEGLTRGELRDSLLAAGMPEDLVDAVTQELENCDFARFAPSASGEEQMDETLARVKRLLHQLNRTRSRRAEG